MEAKDETQYIQRILDGETELYAVLLDRYNRPIYSLIVQMVSCPEDAEELVQDTFLKAFRSLGNYKGESRFSTWLYRIAYNITISFTRKKRQEFLYLEDSTINNVPDEKAEEILCPTDDEERITALIQAIELLNAEEKAVITLFYYEQKSIEEVGEVLDLTVSNVKVKLHRIRKKIVLLMSKKEGASSWKGE
ncbi:MAG: putative polymerase sigma factor [Bacteroidetes bacterium]|nr:putative polymerase sigma factor [Bacteroidota bacterium]